MDLSKWERGEFLGEGNFGKVYKVNSPKAPDGREMAVKEIRITDGYGEQNLRVIKNEIEVLKTVQDDKIVSYYGVLEKEGTVYIFTAYMKMGSLYDYLGANGTLDEQRTRRYTKEILQGLDFLHRKNIIHRDVKAGNVLMESDNSLKLTDFGLSKILGDMTSTGTSQIGTYHWMAPEVIRGEKHRQTADIWSTGCTVVEMLTGNPPFPNCDQLEVVRRLGSGKRPEYKLPDGLSPCVNDFLTKTFDLNPEARPTAAQLLQHEFVAV